MILNCQTILQMNWIAPHNEGSENSATPQSDIAYIENRSDSNLSSISKMNNHLQFELGARYGDSVAKSAPIKAESKHSATLLLVLDNLRQYRHFMLYKTKMFRRINKNH